MKKVAIVTDSTFTISQQMAQEYGVKVIPLYVVMDDKDYSETELDRAQVYARIREKDKSLTTSSSSSIPPRIYLKTWQELSRKVESTLCITFKYDGSSPFS